MAEPELTRHLTMHINRGPTGRERHEEIRADGEPTGVTMHTRTGGPPDFYIQAKELHCGDDTLDLLADDCPDPVEWVLERVK